MRAPVCAVIAVLTFAPAGWAEPVLKSYWVHESHAIVIRRLIDVRVEEVDATTHGTGVVDVERVVSGPSEAGDRYRFTWSHNEETARMCPPSFAFEKVAGRRGVWFLERTPEGTVRPAGELWLLDNAESLQYYLRQLRTMDATSERVAALLRLIRDSLP